MDRSRATPWFKDSSNRGGPHSPTDFNLFDIPRTSLDEWVSSVASDPTQVRCTDVRVSDLGRIPQTLFAAIQKQHQVDPSEAVGIFDEYLGAACPQCLGGITGKMLQMVAAGSHMKTVVGGGAGFQRILGGRCDTCDSAFYFVLWHGDRSQPIAAPASKENNNASAAGAPVAQAGAQAAADVDVAATALAYCGCLFGDKSFDSRVAFSADERREAARGLPAIVDMAAKILDSATRRTEVPEKRLVELAMIVANHERCATTAERQSFVTEALQSLQTPGTPMPRLSGPAPREPDNLMWTRDMDALNILLGSVAKQRAAKASESDRLKREAAQILRKAEEDQAQHLRKAEEDRVEAIKAFRRKRKRCVMCGDTLGLASRLIGRNRHRACVEFREMGEADKRG